METYSSELKLENDHLYIRVTELEDRVSTVTAENILFRAEVESRYSESEVVEIIQNAVADAFVGNRYNPNHYLKPKQ